MSALDMTFNYQSLPRPRSIRLLQLHPAPWNDPIQCSLVLADLDNDDCQYEAISYAWGDATDLKSIICDGCNISVTRNLFEALQRFRHDDATRVVWADAICINQRDVEERNRQVQLMRFIYQKASHVLIWLGHEDDEVVQGDLGCLCRFLCSEFPEGRFGKHPSYWLHSHSVTTSVQDGLPPDPNTGVVTALQRICSATWFGRGWVIQEVALCSSASIYWGYAQIDFEWFGLIVQTIILKFHHDILNIPGIQHAAFICVVFESQRQAHRLLSFFLLLHLTSGFAFSEAKDRVYGLLGLRTLECDPSTGQTVIEPDYGSTTLECYKRIAEHLLLEQKDLKLLSWVDHEPEVKTGWPTWVPDWGRVAESILADAFEENLELKKITVVSKELCGGTECLCIQGFFIDAPDHQVHEYKELGMSKTDIRELKHVQALLRRLEDTYSAECLANTFGAGREMGEEYTTRRLGEYRAFIKWDPPMDQDEMQNLTAPDRYTSPVDKKAADFYNGYLSKWNGHVLFKTGKGMLALGPPAILSSDIVVHFFGASIPFVLRPVDGLWRLVGECYMYDVIHGHVVKNWEESGKTAETFRIY
ncbi:Nn.00g045190.m01.CDS01 [Neocucurbitaria sp. VM-36]